MEASRRVHQNQIGATGFCCMNRIEDNGCRVCIFMLANQLRSAPLSPDGQLVSCRGPECICRRQNDFLARLHFVISELAEAGCFANAVDTDHQVDGRATWCDA